MSHLTAPHPNTLPTPGPLPTTPDLTFDISTIAGNAPPALKSHLGNIQRYFDAYIPPQYKDLPLFGRSIQRRLRVTKVSLLPKVDEPSKMEGRVVCEIEVNEEMINDGGNIHGGCSAFLVDMCSALSLSALSLVKNGTNDISVSQAINMIYHSPAVVGDTLRLVNTSMTLGNRTQSCRTEIWNATHHRLVASGTHVKMLPSPPPPPKAKANL